MVTEFECRIPKVNREKIREKLKKLGAECINKEYLMRRCIFENALLKSRGEHWVRLRSEKDNIITMTYKAINNHKSISGAKEILVNVNDFELAREFLSKVGLEEVSYQENYREDWLLGEIELTLDSWPLIDPVLEIEGKSKAQVIEMVEKLGFSNKDYVCGNISYIYSDFYKIDISLYKRLVF